MIIEIEYYKGDTLLYGQKISFGELKKQLKTIENLYDEKEDNFVALLCRMYHWIVVDDKLQAEYIYDRDTKKFIGVH